MEGQWEWHWPMKTERAGLDGTVMELRGELYFFYAGYGHFPHRVYVTVHNCFTVSPDGQEDWIVYHALLYPGADEALHSMYVQKFDWFTDGTPNLGRPVAECDENSNTQ